MQEIATVWIVVAHFTVMGYGGDALPLGKRLAFVNAADCQAAVGPIRRSFALSLIPVKPDKIFCEKMEIRK